MKICHYHVKSGHRSYLINVSSLDGTNHRRYEAFYKGEKIGGYLSPPDGSWCDMDRARARTYGDTHGRRATG